MCTGVVVYPVVENVLVEFEMPPPRSTIYAPAPPLVVCTTPIGCPVIVSNPLRADVDPESSIASDSRTGDNVIILRGGAVEHAGNRSQDLNGRTPGGSRPGNGDSDDIRRRRG